jgi:hypothetical protein
VRVFWGTLFERADPNKGRFRSILWGAVTNFLADGRDRERSQKRGGGTPALSFDFETSESNSQPILDNAAILMGLST